MVLCFVMTCMLSTPLAATAARMLCSDVAKRKIRRLEFGNGFAGRTRLGADRHHAPVNQRLPGSAIETAAQHGIERHACSRSFLMIAQGNVFALARFGIKEQQVFGMRQMRLDAGIQTVGNAHGNT